jgi:hypothetical protein
MCIVTHAFPASLVASMVLLRHEGGVVPDHWDWLIERPCDQGGPLLAFRVAARCDRACDRAIEATRLADHRWMYLDFEGELAGGRGRVQRVAKGTVLELQETPDRVLVRGAWAADVVLARTWECVRLDGGGDQWQVQALLDTTR